MASWCKRSFSPVPLLPLFAVTSLMADLAMSGPEEMYLWMASVKPTAGIERKDKAQYDKVCLVTTLEDVEAEVEAVNNTAEGERYEVCLATEMPLMSSWTEDPGRAFPCVSANQEVVAYDDDKGVPCVFFVKSVVGAVSISGKDIPDDGLIVRNEFWGTKWEDLEKKWEGLLEQGKVDDVKSDILMIEQSGRYEKPGGHSWREKVDGFRREHRRELRIVANGQVPGQLTLSLLDGAFFDQGGTTTNFNSIAEAKAFYVWTKQSDESKISGSLSFHLLGECDECEIRPIVAVFDDETCSLDIAAERGKRKATIEVQLPDGVNSDVIFTNEERNVKSTPIDGGVKFSVDPHTSWTVRVDGCEDYKVSGLHVGKARECRLVKKQIVLKEAEHVDGWSQSDEPFLLAFKPLETCVVRANSNIQPDEKKYGKPHELNSIGIPLAVEDTGHPVSDVFFDIGEIRCKYGTLKCEKGKWSLHPGAFTADVMPIREFSAVTFDELKANWVKKNRVTQQEKLEVRKEMRTVRNMWPNMQDKIVELAYKLDIACPMEFSTESDGEVEVKLKGEKEWSLTVTRDKPVSESRKFSTYQVGSQELQLSQQPGFDPLGEDEDGGNIIRVRRLVEDRSVPAGETIQAEQAPPVEDPLKQDPPVEEKQAPDEDIGWDDNF